MYKNSITHYIAKIMVDIMFYVGIVCVFAVPWMSSFMGYSLGRGAYELWEFKIILFLSGACSVYILFNLKQMFKTLLGGNPFIEKNIGCFRKMAVSCALISLIYIVKCFFMFTSATLVISIIFIIGTLFCLTLKDIFKQAVYYKEEHDWTV